MKTFSHYFIVFVLLTCPKTMLGQEKINLQPKALKKAIEKTWDLESYELDKIGKENSSGGQYFLVSVSRESHDEFKYVYIGRVNSCRSGGCSSSKNSYSSSHEYFDYFILFDQTGSIELVKVYNYRATHGYQITAKRWLKQFIGSFDKTNFRVGKNIDAISGATISTHAITRDINKRKTNISRFLKTDSAPNEISH